MRSRFQAWKTEHNTLWQFILFNLMSMITTVVDLGSFSLFHYWIFVPCRQQPFAWWIIRYAPEDGGLGAFLAFALSFALSQTFNFFLQRKTTFKADNNVLLSGVLYAVMVVGVYFLQLWVPSLLLAGMVAALGQAWGGVLVKMINMTLSMLIQFPMNKWVIMRQRTKPQIKP